MRCRTSLERKQHVCYFVSLAALHRQRLAPAPSRPISLPHVRRGVCEWRFDDSTRGGAGKREMESEVKKCMVRDAYLADRHRCFGFDPTRRDVIRPALPLPCPLSCMLLRPTRALLLQLSPHSAFPCFRPSPPLERRMATQAPPPLASGGETDHGIALEGRRKMLVEDALSVSALHQLKWSRVDGLKRRISCFNASQA